MNIPVTPQVTVSSAPFFVSFVVGFLPSYAFFNNGNSRRLQSLWSSFFQLHVQSTALGCLFFPHQVVIIVDLEKF